MGRHAIYRAILGGDSTTLRELVTCDTTKLTQPDKMGNTPAHLSCMFAKPECLRILHECSVSLSEPCDVMGFGSPIFYATYYGRVSLLEMIWELGYNLEDPCDKYGNPPIYYAELKQNQFMIKSLKGIIRRGTIQDFKATVISSAFRGHMVRKQCTVYRCETTQKGILKLSPSM